MKTGTIKATILIKGLLVCSRLERCKVRTSFEEGLEIPTQDISLEQRVRVGRESKSQYPSIGVLRGFTSKTSLTNESFWSILFCRSRQTCFDETVFLVRMKAYHDNSKRGGKEMNKAQLTEEVAAETGLSKGASGEAVDAVISAISGCLAGGGRVTLVGFGTFRVEQRRARTGRNPQTGAALQIPAKRVLKFVPGTSLRENVS